MQKLISFLLLASCSFAIPSLLSLDGFLTAPSGNALDGDYSFNFSLYTDASAGTLLWSEEQTITVSSGKLNTLLGSVSALALPFDEDYYLEVQINTETLSPRYRIASSAYSHTSKTSQSMPSFSSPQVTCDSGHEGYVYYDSNTGIFMGCSKDGFWAVLSEGKVGTEENPGLSCKDILEKAPSSSSSVYWVKPTDISFQAYCDMETDGGGWTRVGYFPNGLSDVPSFTTTPTEVASPTLPGFNKAYSRVTGTQIRMAKKIGAMASGTLQAAVSSTSWQPTIIDTPQAQAYDSGSNTESCHLGLVYSLSAANGDYYYHNGCCWGRGDGDLGSACCSNLDYYTYGSFSDHIWVR